MCSVQTLSTAINTRFFAETEMATVRDGFAVLDLPHANETAIFAPSYPGWSGWVGAIRSHRGEILAIDQGPVYDATDAELADWAMGICHARICGEFVGEGDLS